MGAHTSLKVRDVVDVENRLSDTVAAGAPFRDVVERFASRHDLRSLFVLDDDQALCGIITRQDLLRWAARRFGVDAEGGENWRDAYRVMTAATAGEAAARDSDEARLVMDDSLEHALRVMLEHDVIDLPVVDDDGKILGDLRLSALLARVLASAG